MNLNKDKDFSMQSQVSVIHYGITCNVCRQNNFSGIRYKCKQCFRYDLCAKCKGLGHHDEHSMRKIYSSENPAPQVSNFGLGGLLLGGSGLSILNSDRFTSGFTRGFTIDDDSDEDDFGISSHLASILSMMEGHVSEPVGYDEDDVIHHGVQCNKCRNRNIQGIRYKCLVCDDYDLCNECQSTGHHRHHGMTKITKPKFSISSRPSSHRSLAPVACKGKFEYGDICKAFKNTLGIHDNWFMPEKNMCYCTSCHSGRGDDMVYHRGHPMKAYALPVGWFRFGLAVPPKVHQLDAFEKWHRGYHGTKADKIVKILEIGDIVPAGMKVRGGGKISERPGHFTDDRKPRGFNTKQVFLSPSIMYAGYETYATSTSFTDPNTRDTYRAKVALQVLIEPGSYRIEKETVGARDQIDPNIDNSQLEWSTDQHGAVIIYGLLVQLSK